MSFVETSDSDASELSDPDPSDSLSDPSEELAELSSLAAFLDAPATSLTVVFATSLEDFTALAEVLALASDPLSDSELALDPSESLSLPLADASDSGSAFLFPPLTFRADLLFASPFT